MAEAPPTTEPNPSPLPMPAFAGRSDDLAALESALTDAAAVSGGLWISYLFVLFYLLIAAAGVTHGDLLFESPVKLPFLNVDLPLTGFFWLGPLLFLIVHAYVLLHFVMFAGKVAAFDHALRTQIPDLEVRTRLRRQLPANIFIQFLAGPRDVRDGLTGLLLWLIALISLVIGPIALLLYFQLQFLPYHSEPITWLQRIVVVIELALVWRYWPAISLRDGFAQDRDPTGRRPWVDRIQRVGTLSAMSIISAGSLLLVFGIAIFPGERLEQALRDVDPFSLRQTLVAGPVDTVERRPRSLWSNRLVLPGLDIAEHLKLTTEDKIAAVTETMSLRGRHLEGAVLIRANLRKVDFTAARLQGAWLDGADLRGARFGCADAIDQEADRDRTPDQERCTRLEGISLRAVDLQGQNLTHLGLQGASLDRTDLRDADLTQADLSGASLRGAKLDKARLGAATLTGADLAGAQLSGAILDQAKLQGANLLRATLVAASIKGANLNGATLEDADLTAAQLYAAQLIGAALDGARLGDARLQKADLRGASLRRAALPQARLDFAQLDGTLVDDAQLLGANLTQTSFAASRLVGTFVWRSRPDAERFPGALVKDVMVVASKPCPTGSRERHNGKQICPWTADDVAELRTRLEAAGALATANTTPPVAAALLAPATKVDPDQSGETAWQAVQAASSDAQSAEQAMTRVWIDLACGGSDALFVARRLIARMQERTVTPLLTPSAMQRVASALAAPTCAGTAGLRPDERAVLAGLAK